MGEVVIIIIPNFNGKELLATCLPSVFSQTFKNFEVWVVDNGSTDNSVGFLKRNFPQVQLIINKKNLGFAKAVNLAIVKTQSEYIVLLNNDTKVDKNWLENLVKAAKKHGDVASVASKIFSFNGKKIESVGDKINIVGQAYPAGLSEPARKYDKPGYILGATGGASLFRRSAFDKIGLFDEDFFFYFEDVDWALRAQINGFKSYYEPAAIVYHKVGATAKKFGNFVEYLRFRNTIFLVIKNFPSSLFFKRGRWFKIPLVWLHTFYFFIKKGMFWEALKVVFDLTTRLPKLIKKRAKIMRLRKVEIAYLDNLMEEKRLKILFWKF